MEKSLDCDKSMVNDDRGFWEFNVWTDPWVVPRDSKTYWVYWNVLCSKTNHKETIQGSSGISATHYFVAGVYPVMHTDCTNAKVNGKPAYVFVCATPDGKPMYFARDKKGHEGVKGTVAEDYQGILVHDHERTFYNYGTGHQECLAHVLRYLKDSIQNEPERTWNGEMRSLIQEMIHYRNNLTSKLLTNTKIIFKHLFFFCMGIV